MKVVLITGGFDPLHKGHIHYINAANCLGDVLIVGLNSDAWLTRKKGKPFLPWNERSAIISNLSSVSDVIDFDDNDDTSNDAIRRVRHSYRDWEHLEIIFANGGDRTSNNTPEMENNKDVTFRFGVGGEHKANSSSDILRNWCNNTTERPWGIYTVLSQYPGIKIKELHVDPGKRLSMQKHKHRSEFWFIAEGIAHLYINGHDSLPLVYNKYDHVDIPVGQLHMLCNNGTDILKIIEIQYGEYCEESDITRIDHHE